MAGPQPQPEAPGQETAAYEQAAELERPAIAEGSVQLMPYGLSQARQLGALGLRGFVESGAAARAELTPVFEDDLLVGRSTTGPSGSTKPPMPQGTPRTYGTTRTRLPRGPDAVRPAQRHGSRAAGGRGRRPAVPAAAVRRTRRSPGRGPASSGPAPAPRRRPGPRPRAGGWHPAGPRANPPHRGRRTPRPTGLRCPESACLRSGRAPGPFPRRPRRSGPGRSRPVLRAVRAAERRPADSAPRPAVRRRPVRAGPGGGRRCHRGCPGPVPPATTNGACAPVRSSAALWRP